MENRTVNYKNYVIDTEAGTEKGIFFRSPIQKVNFDAYCEEPMLSAWKYSDNIKKPLRRLYQVILGNSSIVNNVEKWKEDMDWAGFSANILCFPIYFKRDYRKLKAVSVGNDNIQSIESYGYEGEWNNCTGRCDMERTTIILKNGKKIRKKRNESYHYTYEHIVKKIIDEKVV